VLGRSPSGRRVKVNCRSHKQRSSSDPKQDATPAGTGSQRERQDEHGDSNQADRNIDGASGRKARLGKPADGASERIVAGSHPPRDQHESSRCRRRDHPKERDDQPCRPQVHGRHPEVQLIQ